MVLDIMQERALMAEIQAGTIQPRPEEIYDTARFNERDDMPPDGTPITFFDETQVGNSDGTVGERRLSTSQKRAEGGGSQILTNQDSNGLIPTDWDRFLVDGIALNVKCKGANLAEEILKRMSFIFTVDNHRIMRGLGSLAPWGGGLTGFLSFPNHSQSPDPTTVTTISDALGSYNNGTPDPRSVARWGANNRIVLQGKNAEETRFRLDVYVDGISRDGALYPRLRDFDDENNNGSNLFKIPDGVVASPDIAFEDPAVVIQARVLGSAFMRTLGTTS